MPVTEDPGTYVIVYTSGVHTAYKRYLSALTVKLVVTSSPFWSTHLLKVKPTLVGITVVSVEEDPSVCVTSAGTAPAPPFSMYETV